MNDKVKNSSNHIQNRVTEAPIIALTTELEKAFQNFKNSPEILEHLQKTVKQLQNITDWVKLPYALLLEELQVSNKVHELIGKKAATFAANDTMFEHVA